MEKIAKAKISSIERALRSLNFYKNKSKNVFACAKMLIEEYGRKVPEDIETLILLPGVGRKTANVFIAEYDGDGIGVDTHVLYISQYLGWTKNNTPEKIEHDLKELFQKKYWSDVNTTLVRFGKTHTSRKKKDELLDEVEKNQLRLTLQDKNLYK